MFGLLKTPSEMNHLEEKQQESSNTSFWDIVYPKHDLGIWNTKRFLIYVVVRWYVKFMGA